MSPSLIAIDDRRRAAITESEQAQARRNAASKEIGEAKKAKDEARANALMAEVGELKDSAAGARGQREGRRDQLFDERSPRSRTCRSPDVPDGADEHGNVEHHQFGAEARSLCVARRSSMSISAKRWDSWISRRRPSSRARALSC